MSLSAGKMHKKTTTSLDNMKAKKNEDTIFLLCFSTL